MTRNGVGVTWDAELRLSPTMAIVSRVIHGIAEG